jgi:hypothetical protein
MNDHEDKKRNQKQKPEAVSLQYDEILRRNAGKKPVEIISLDMGEEGEMPLELSAETTLDLLREAQQDKYSEEIGRYTDDQAIQESLDDQQERYTGHNELYERLTEHNATSPTLSGGDVDAAWDEANVGEETAGGMAPTPDQDMVEEIGEAYGIVYEDDEPLRTGDKLEERDEHRWELDPESVEQENEEEV